MTVHFNPLNHSPPFRPLIHGRISLLFLFNLLILLLLSHQTRPVGAQHGPPPPWSDPGLSPNQNFSPSMGGIIIVLIAALFFMGFFSIYIRHCSGQDTSAGGGTRRNLVGGRSNRGSRGLDPAVIESFPTFGFSHVKNLKIGKGALECAVCLNEFEGDDTLRLIPKCDHVFHTECIDAWLVAHTTCPVCRANLVPEPGESVQGPVEVQNDFVVEVQPEFEANSNESMEVPLHDRGDTSRRLNRNRTFKDMIRNMSGRPRWVGKYSRSFSTGHVAVKQWENMDRFTLRVPEEVRKQIMSGQLKRSTSLVVLPRESSSRRGYRTGFAGEGSSQRGRFSGRFDRGGGRSDRWVFSLVPPFFSRAPSVKSPRVAAPPSREGSLRSSRAVPGAVDSVRSVRGDVGFDYSARSGRVAV